jgi:hypothetical protein
VERGSLSSTVPIPVHGALLPRHVGTRLPRRIRAPDIAVLTSSRYAAVAFLDAGFLLFVTSRTPAFANTFDYNLFYPSSVVKVNADGPYCDAAAGEQCYRMQPMVDVISS